MGYWDSKSCRIVAGLAALAAAVLAITAGLFDYGVSEWGPGTWAAVGLLVACLLLCCCVGGPTPRWRPK
ncbi:MAG: hypothetical protein SCH98_18150 [Deferrisomatales bacterium]|nr:hypothetical protein [Deferrisomatales bacterium]